MPSGFERSVPAVPASLSELRRAAVEFAEAQGAPAETVAAVRLAISELASNAVLHAFVDRPPGTVTLSARRDRRRLALRVVDDGRGVTPRQEGQGAGMGMATVAKLADGLEVGAGPGGVGTEVRVTFALPAPPPERDGWEARLLRAADRLGGGLAWPAPGVEGFAALLVGRLADVATVDLVDAGTLRRLAAEVLGDPELSAWLAGSLPPLKPGTATWKALREEGPTLVVHDRTVPRTANGPGEQLDLGWWVAVALRDLDGRPQALVGLGGRGTTPVPDERRLALVAELADRVAPAMRPARAAEDLRATRARLTEVLDALDEPVVVGGPDGTLVHANAAAARLAGLPDGRAAVRRGRPRAGVELRDATGAPLAVARLLAPDGPDELQLHDADAGTTTRLALHRRPLDPPSGLVLVRGRVLPDR